MKYLFSICCLISIGSQAQDDLKFNQQFIQCIDKWVAIQPDKDSSFPFGFVYFDSHAGLTLNYEGRFKISTFGKFIPQKIDNANMKIRIQPTSTLLAVLPSNRLKELDVAPVPDWLSYYKSDTNSAASLYQYGFLYNAWNQCATALKYLQRANQIDPDYDKLKVEMAFSYNCLNLYDSAIIVLQEALQADSADAYVNKELIYAQMKSGRLEQAAASCKKAIRICTDQKFNGENCYNILYTYYLKKDKTGFNDWLAEAKKWCAKNKQFMNLIEIMEKKMNKERP